MNKLMSLATAAFVTGLLALTGTAHADDKTAPAPAAAAEPEFVLTIKDHKFEPATLEVPADKKIVLIVKNQDDSAEEFESKSMKREKMIAAKSEAKINVGPLKAGEYPFVGEFHEDVTKGVLTAK